MKKLGIIILFLTFINNVQANHLNCNKKDEKPNESAQQAKSTNFIISFSKQVKGSKLSIYDTRGNNIVTNFSLNEELQEINLSNHPKGTYFIEIINGDKICISKVVIQ